MCNKFILRIIGFFLLILSSISYAEKVIPSLEPEVLRAVTEMCNKKIALLGEASHGDGVTFEIKTKIVKKLIEKCGYNTFIIESGVYGPLDLQRKRAAGQIITYNDIRDSISSIWSHSKEVSPLLELLALKLNTSKEFYFSGMDDQLSGIYAKSQMASDLSAGACLIELSKFTSLEYYKDPSLFRPKNKSKLINCLNIAEINNQNLNQIYKSIIIANLRRLIYRNFHLDSKNETEALNHRALSMFMNFRNISSLDFRNQKVIVWAASSHIAKTLKDIRDNYINFGNYVYNHFGSESFSLAFTAYSGSIGSKLFPPETISKAPKASLEGQFDNGENQFAFLDPLSLERIGNVSARPLGYVFHDLNWFSIFNGIFWIKEEHPATSILNPLLSKD